MKTCQITTREIDKRKSFFCARKSHILQSAIKTRENTTGFSFLQLRVDGSIKGLSSSKFIIIEAYKVRLLLFSIQIQWTHKSETFVCTYFVPNEIDWFAYLRFFWNTCNFFSIFSFVFTEWNRLFRIFQNSLVNFSYFNFYLLKWSFSSVKKRSDLQIWSRNWDKEFQYRLISSVGNLLEKDSFDYIFISVP